MKVSLLSIARTAAAAAALTFAGCTRGSVEELAGNETAIEDGPPDTLGDEGHNHPTEGPHGGDLIELGEEEYHAELVHEGNSVSVYILDSTAKQAVPIEAADVTINVKHNGKPEQFKLAAAPQDGDAVGKASRFTAEDPDLASHIDAEDAGPRLVVTIDGKSFNGAIEHHHGEGDHGHSHDN